MAGYGSVLREIQLVGVHGPRGLMATWGLQVKVCPEHGLPLPEVTLSFSVYPCCDPSRYFLS